MLQEFDISEGRGWTQFFNLIGNSFYCRLLFFVTLQQNHSSAEHCSIYWYQGCLYKYKHSCCHICIDFIGSLHASAISKYTQFQSGSKNLSSIGNIWKAWKRKWILGSTSKCLTISKSMKCEMRFFFQYYAWGKGRRATSARKVMEEKKWHRSAGMLMLILKESLWIQSLQRGGSQMPWHVRESSETFWENVLFRRRPWKGCSLLPSASPGEGI